MSIVIVQALCPDRHCIMAVAAEDVAAERATILLKAGLVSLIDGGALNGWCGLCGARWDTWIYETGRTRFGSMEEAGPVLRALELAQLAYAHDQHVRGLAYDKSPETQN